MDKPTAVALLIFTDGTWGSFKGPGQHDANVIDFFDKVLAICGGESSFNPKAVNGEHVGLFQIATKLHADLIGSANMMDPLSNIHVAAMLSRQAWNGGKGDMFAPWQAYTEKTTGYVRNLGHGKKAYTYIKSLDSAAKLTEAQDLAFSILGGRVPVKSTQGQDSSGNWLTNMVGTGIGAEIGNISRGVNAVTDPLSSFLGWLKDAAIPVGVFVLALALLIFGIWFLISQTKAGKLVEGVAGGPTLKAVKAIA